MVTIDTQQDFLRLLREDSEFKSEVRRIILSEELLNLPAMVSRIDGRLDGIDGHLNRVDGRLDGIDVRIDRMETRQDRMEVRLDSIDGRLDRMETRQNRMEVHLDSIDGRLDRMETRQERMATQQERMATQQERMATQQDRMNDTLGELKGNMLEFQLQNKLVTVISDKMVLRNGAIVRGGQLTSASNEFSDAIYEAYQSGVITMSERNRVNDTDSIVRATSRETLNAVYVAIEASYVIDHTDVNRAHQTAEIVAKIFPEAEVFAMVCGKSINSNGADTAQNLGVVVYDSV